jgi:DNA-binding transcriptional regulator PaaX
MDRDFGEPKSPETIRTGTGQQLFLVLAELVARSPAPVATTALIYVLRTIGCTTEASRQAIARATDDGLIQAERRGKFAYRSITASGRSLILARAPAYFEEPSARVDSTTRVVALWLTVPERHSGERRRLYAALRALDFGSPSPGLWINLDPTALGAARQLTAEFGLAEQAVGLVGSLGNIGRAPEQILQRAWGLDEVAARYSRFTSTFDALSPRTADEHLVAFLAVMNEWRALRTRQHRLHDQLLTEVVQRASVTLATARARWESSALRRWNELARLADRSALPPWRPSAMSSMSTLWLK